MSEKKPRKRDLQGKLFEREERAEQKSPEIWCSECDGHFPFGTIHNCPYASDDWPYDD